MNVRLYSSFTKRKNSTKVPGSGDSYTTKTCVLKDTTGIESPILTLSTSPAGTSYAYIPDFNRYYFVNNVTFQNGTYDLSLVSDPLGTHRSEIGDYQGFILRSEDNTFYNPKLTDPVNAPVGEITHKVDSTEIVVSAGNPLFTVSGIGTYMLSILGKPDGGLGDNGLARTYALSASQLNTFASQFVNPTIMQSIMNQFTNAMDALISCFYLPISASHMNTHTEDAYIGDTAIMTSVPLVQNRFISISGDISYVNAMPLTFANNYLVRPPYATYCIYLPFFGMASIDANVLLEGSKLTYSLDVDVCTGDIVYYIKSSTGSKIGQYNGNCATQVPIGSQQISNPLGLGGGLITAIGGAGIGFGTLAAGGGFAAAAAGLGAFAAGAGTMLKSVELHTQTNGSSSSALGIKGGDNIEVHSFIANPTYQPEEVRTVCGLMTHKIAYAKDHTGFLQFLNASIDIETDVSSDIDNINQYMNSGFFFE